MPSLDEKPVGDAPAKEPVVAHDAGGAEHEKELGTTEDYVDPKLEKRIIRKIDANLITLFGALYLMSFLDRSNIGNANLTGFSKDLHLVSNEYGAAVSVVYATYVVFEPFWTVLLKILTPKFLMTASCIAWSALTIGTAFVKDFSQLVGVRVLLGATEAGKRFALIKTQNLTTSSYHSMHPYLHHNDL
jgi:hypothetical protein